MQDLGLCIPNVNINEPKDYFTLKDIVTQLRINKFKSQGTNYLEGRSLLLIALKGIEFQSPTSKLTTRVMHNFLYRYNTQEFTMTMPGYDCTI